MTAKNFVFGVIVSEGSFHVEFFKAEDCNFGVSTRHTFTLKMNDEYVVRKVYEELGFGDFVSKYEGHRLNIRRQDNIEKLISWIERNKTKNFINSDKYSSYLKWKETWENRDRYMESESGMIEFAEEANKINPSNRGRSLEETKEVIKNG